MCVNCGPTFGCVVGCPTFPEGREPSESDKLAMEKLKPAEHVNHPAHYGGEDNPYEVIKVLRQWDIHLARGFCWGSLIKYTARAGKKGSSVEDRRKAEWYASELVSVEAEIYGSASHKTKIQIGTATVEINWADRTFEIEYGKAGYGTSGGPGGASHGYFGGGGSAGISMPHIGGGSGGAGSVNSGNNGGN